MVRHVALVAVAEIGADVLGPLVGLRQQQPARPVGVDLGADLLDDRVRLGEVLVVRALALAQIGDRVEPEPVDAHVEPAPHHLHHGPQHARIVVIEVRLVRKEPMPVIGARFRIPGPVGFLGVGEDDTSAEIFMVGIAPDVPVPRIAAEPGASRALEPGMLVRGVIDHQLGDHPQASALGFCDEAAKILHRAEIGIDAAVVGDVVAVVTAGARIERQQPQCRHAELVQVIEPLGQAGKVADAVAVAVGEGFDVQLIDDCVLVPEVVAAWPRARR